MNEEKSAIDTLLRGKWDTAGIAFLGAGLGALVQGSHEFQHNLVAPSGVQDPMTSSLIAVALAALAGTFLFTAITVAHNVTVIRPGGNKPAMRVDYHRSDFAGAVLGILLVLAHEAFNFLSGRWRSDFLASADPFSHIVWELIIVALGGELLFRAVAKVRNWGSIEPSI